MKILVIGEQCKDIYIYCKCERLCPEAPVPVLIPIEKTENWGMAANTYNNLLSIGEMGYSGHDADKVFSYSQSVKIRYIDKSSGYIIVRIDENDIHPRIKNLNNILRRYKHLDAIVISDYNKGFLWEEDIEKITNFAKQNNILIFLDSKKKILGNWSKDIDFIKVNLKEYNILKDNLSKPENYCKNLIVTLGEKGAICINKNISVQGEKVPVYNLSGAGDTWLAAFTIRYIETKNIKESMIYANKAAAVAVSKVGVVAINKNEIK